MTGNSAIESSLADSWWGIAFLFLLFCGFLAGSLGYGAWLRRRLFPGSTALAHLSDSFLLASLLLWASASALSAAGLLALLPGWAWLALFLPGLYLGRPVFLDLLRALGERRVFAAAAVVIFLVRGLTAAVPAQHGDPLLYHLLGPRLWREAGGFTMHPDLPNALLASSWEILYVWPQLFWASARPLFGLVEAQLFSQWLHLFLAWGGSALLVMRLFEREVRSRWLPLVGLAALFVAGVQWTAALAKNDAGIAFWTLGAAVYFSDGFRKERFSSFLLSGIFAGLALSGKVTALLSLAPLLGALLLAAKPWRNFSLSMRGALLWAGGLLLGAAPVYARNYLLSGNPFFPLFPGLFPSPWLSRSWEAHFAQVHPSSPLEALPRLWLRVPELWRESPFVVLAALFLAIAALRFVLRKPKADCGEIPALLAGALAAYAIFVVMQAKEIELRYLGASLELLAAGGVFAALRWSAGLPTGRLQAGVATLVAIALFASSKLPLHVLHKVWKSPIGVEALRTHSAGEAKAWLRANARDSFTVVAGDNEMYYLTPLRAAVLTERPDLDAATHDVKELKEFLGAICGLTQAKFLLDARPTGPHGLEAKFGKEAFAKAMVFSAQGANVYELGRLDQRCSSSAQ